MERTGWQTTMEGHCCGPFMAAVFVYGSNDETGRKFPYFPSGWRQCACIKLHVTSEDAVGFMLFPFHGFMNDLTHADSKNSQGKCIKCLNPTHVKLYSSSPVRLSKAMLCTTTIIQREAEGEPTRR